MRSPASSSANDTTAGAGSSVAAKASSSSAGTTWFTAKGRSVRSRSSASASRSWSAGRFQAPRLPSAPASDTAAANAGDVKTLIPAWMIGTSIPTRLHRGERIAAISTFAIRAANPTARSYPSSVASASTVQLSGGLNVSVAQQGDSEVAVVLLPGPTDSWVSYRAVLDRLPSSRRAIAMSPRGHGDSDKPASGYGVEDFAGDVCDLLDALDVPKAVLVGHSGSCLVVRRVALDASARVAGLVLEASPVSLAGDAGLIEFVATVLRSLEDPIDPDFARHFLLDTSSPSWRLPSATSSCTRP